MDSGDERSIESRWAGARERFEEVYGPMSVEEAQGILERSDNFPTFLAPALAGVEEWLLTALDARAAASAEEAVRAASAAVAATREDADDDHWDDQAAEPTQDVADDDGW